MPSTAKRRTGVLFIRSQLTPMRDDVCLDKLRFQDFGKLSQFRGYCSSNHRSIILTEASKVASQFGLNSWRDTRVTDRKQTTGLRFLTVNHSPPASLLTRGTKYCSKWGTECSWQMFLKDSTALSLTTVSSTVARDSRGGRRQWTNSCPPTRGVKLPNCSAQSEKYFILIVNGICQEGN